MKIFFGILIALLFGINASAQTVTIGPVDTTMKIAWELPANITLADAPTFEARFRDSTNPGSFTVLTGVNCVAGTPINCTSPLTAALVTLINKVGKHDLTLSYFRADTGEGSQSIPFTLVTPSTAPTNLKIIR